MIIKKKSKEIIFIISSLGSGGAERVVSTLSNYIQKDSEYNVSIVLKKNDLFYNLDKNIELHVFDKFTTSFNLSILNRFFNNFMYILSLRALIKQKNPYRVISFMPETNVLSIITSKMTFLKKNFLIISERIDPRVHPRSYLLTFLTKFLYRYSDRLVIQTDNLIPWCIKSYSPKSIEVIPNPVNDNFIDSLRLSRKLSHLPINAVSIGRLNNQKGFDILIRAIAKLKENGKNINLKIIGKGEEKQKLLTIIKDLKLDEQITIQNSSKNIIEELQKSDILIISSRFEGFPNVLLEGLACGTPTVSTDCKSGPSVLMRHYPQDLLCKVDSVEDLEKSIEFLIGEYESNSKIFNANRNIIAKEYSLSKIASMWIKK